MAIQKREFMSLTGRTINAQKYDIIISNGTWSITGKMKNPFSYQLSAKWADLFNGLIPGAELLMKTGNASLTTGIFSQKYFQGGNNLQFTSEFRVYDDGKQQFSPVIRASKQLANLTVADSFSTKRAVSDAVRAGTKAYNTGKEAIGSLTEGKVTEAGVKFIQGAEQYANEIFNKAVNVQVGDFFRCNKMAVENLNVTYSKELTHTGPLYADFSIGFLSLRAINRGGGELGVDTIFDKSQFIITQNGKPLEK